MHWRITIAVGIVAVAALSGVAAADEPMADAGLDQEVSVNTTVQLDGTGSTHPDGEIQTYQWDVTHDGGTTVYTSCMTCSRTEFTPSAPGTYEVTLSVTDGASQRATDTLYVTVTDAGPSVELDGPLTVDTDDPATFEAAAESPDAELETVSWAVEDDIVTERPLDGGVDTDAFQFAFGDPDTYRLQVVVRDVNGRTTYEELFVQAEAPPEPSGGSSGGSSGGTETPTPEETPEETPRIGDPNNEESVIYEADGYYQNRNAGADVADSAYIGTEVTEYSFDDGENAPWGQPIMEQAGGSAWEGIQSQVYGEERQEHSCTITGDSIDMCSQVAHQIESHGETSHVYSPDKSGTYHEYGLRDVERTEGPNPLENRDEVDKIHVTIITQPEEDGLVDQASDIADGVVDGVDSAFGYVRSGGESA
ncbi:probable secreted glycoprotein [Natronomonas pharaonis DSM 2160]|uniref:Probable secreted glycoprotein n=1 Tax=Natronomonas pharaonis (strain ATCC 35678 / DSM 2160 / CIP 103997 / JCM 8858 / NBRC 14720 / NCIMB 2260 / Gabara) TaxID=348780 RepID=A0A1U7EWM0_NATPD|nr:PKD domain-containing protein [Natronomonas pharaonis]CAI49499.1 probable secreted glycoprotein [Natronomonas pharaonis DSM 2160]